MEKVSEWKNTTSGHLGVVKYDEKGVRRGVSVPPGGSVFLTEKDRVATANAPKRAADNPFQNGALQLVTPEAEMAQRRPIGDANAQPVVAPEEPEDKAGGEPQIPEEERPSDPEPVETGAAAPPEGPAPEGQAAPHEEVAEAPAVAPAPTPVPTPKPTPQK